MLNFGAVASQKQILCPSRDFTFSHSQGHSRRFVGRPITSDLPPTPDILGARRHVSNVPIADSCTAAKRGSDWPYRGGENSGGSGLRTGPGAGVGRLLRQRSVRRFQ
jgi:hypothetical protein